MQFILKIILISCFLLPGCTVSIDPGDEEDSWLVKNTEHFNFYYNEYEVFIMPSWYYLDIDQIAEKQEQGYREILEDLDVDYEGVINFYIYPPEYVEGRPVQSGYADPTFETVYLRYHGRPFGKHEISHIISEQTLGRASIRLLNEGLAETLEYYQPASLEVIQDTFTWTIDTYSQGNESYIQVLLRKGDNMSTRVFYPQAGWFVRFLVGTYGMELFKQLYTVDLSDIESRLVSLYDRTITEIEDEYFAFYRYTPEYNKH